MIFPFALVSCNMKYWKVPASANLQQDTIEIGFTIERETSATIINKCHGALQTNPADIYLAAVIDSFAHTFTDRPTPLVFNEGHGREPSELDDIDISRTVGWFTTMVSLHVPVGAGDDPIHNPRPDEGPAAQGVFELAPIPGFSSLWGFYRICLRL